METTDYRPLFKRVFGAGYFKEKAKELRINRDHLSRIIAGKINNPDVYDQCLTELRERIERRKAEEKRIQELTQTHQL